MAATARYLIIVRRDDPELYRHLREMVGSGAIQVILDRRRYRAEPTEPERERRRPVSVERDVARREYVIVRPESA